MNAAYAEGNVKELQSTYSFVIIVHKDIFKQLPNELNVSGYFFEPKVISRDFVLGMLDATDPIGLYSDFLATQRGLSGDARTQLRNQISARYPTAVEFKGMLFTMLASERARSTPLVHDIKDGNMIIIPENFGFKVLKQLPKRLLSYIGGWST